VRRGTGRFGGNRLRRRRYAAPPRPENTSLSAWWALVPFVSGGLFVWAPFLYATLRTGSARFRNFTVVYACLAVVEFMLIRSGTGSGGALALVFTALPFVGAVHTLAIREEFRRRLEVRNHPTLLSARHQADLRAEGRALVARAPAQARAMGVGRPDLLESFDAGLVDINHAPSWVLMGIPGVDPQVVDQIIDLRSTGSGFRSLEDIDFALNLPPDQVSALRERAVFLPIE
jgi:hypothetical protein